MTETWTIALTTSMTRNPPNQRRSSLCQFPLQSQEASRENAVWEPYHKVYPVCGSERMLTSRRYHDCHLKSPTISKLTKM
jgi:hypothetical protein